MKAAKILALRAIEYVLPLPLNPRLECDAELHKMASQVLTELGEDVPTTIKQARLRRRFLERQA